MTSLLRLVVAAELRHLRPALVPRLLHDRRDFRIGGEGLPAVEIPVKDHPDAISLVGVAEHERALRAVLLALLGTLGGEDTAKAVEVLDRGRCQEHPGPPLRFRRLRTTPRLTRVCARGGSRDIGQLPYSGCPSRDARSE